MPHTFTNLLAHVIFSTKERAALIPDAIRPQVHACIGGIIRELGGTALLVNGVADHVHALIRLPATLAITECMRVVKTNSSRWVHEQWSERRGFAWQTGYGAFSVSESSRSAVEAYIARQAEHHRKISFQEEFLEFLRKQGIAYDERYIWE